MISFISFKVRAVDDDIGRNSDVTYELSPESLRQHAELFALEPGTGRLSVRGLLDYEQTRELTLLVSAMDGGLDPNTAYTSIVVHVEDMNDNAPVIVVHSFAPQGTGDVTLRLPTGGRDVVQGKELFKKEIMDGDEGREKILLKENHWSITTGIKIGI